jgi:hypothetical protein
MKGKELLQFFAMTENEPARTCNCCGQIAHFPDMKQAKFFPFTDEREDCCFVVCSEQCEQAFLTYPTLDNYLMKCIQGEAAYKKLEIKLEFVLWFQKVDFITTNN